MRSINKVILIGNLTRDPELRNTTNGQAVATFGIATNRDWVTKDGMRHTSTEFHELVAWARLAEICQQYLKKGKLIYVEGYLKTRSWDTPEGVKKFKTEIIVQDMIILEKRPKDSDVPAAPAETLEEGLDAMIEEEPAAAQPAAQLDLEKTPEKAPEETPETPKKKEKKAGPSIEEDLGL